VHQGSSLPPPPDRTPAWAVRSLGTRLIGSPLGLSTLRHDEIPDYVPDDARILFDLELRGAEVPDPAQSFEKAGPRETIFFDPKKTRAAIVTSGGLCPGINNVIR
jgi:6-phosphofructokinase 1